jgi:hypothetical protein
MSSSNPTHVQAFAYANKLGEQLIFMYGSWCMACIVASATFWPEMLSGRPSLRALDAIVSVSESPFGGHKVIAAKFG